MTPEQKTAVKETWARVVPIADTAAGLFYERLFETDPTTRALFKPERMPEQRRKLVQALAAVVGGLDNLGAILPAIQELGRRHAGYGVTDAHYRSVGAALLWTLERGLGPAWTEKAAAAWAEAYGVVSGAMRAAAGRGPSPRVRTASPDQARRGRASSPSTATPFATNSRTAPSP
jgi:nitric oxide dioxygenase